MTLFSLKSFLSLFFLSSFPFSAVYKQTRIIKSTCYLTVCLAKLIQKLYITSKSHDENFAFYISKTSYTVQEGFRELSGYRKGCDIEQV